ncbi:MAG: hypothetical protein ACTHKF_02750 [Candidatus Nitrosocosmicus sp.]
MFVIDGSSKQSELNIKRLAKKEFGVVINLRIDDLSRPFIT